VSNPKTTEEMRQVFECLMQKVDNGELDLEITAHDFNDWLDMIANDDGFGTEGQSDPRGDQRDNR
jgi:hypothetical protein